MNFESAITEFKREYTEDIRKTIAVFANTKGGTLYIGIADNGTVVEVDKIENLSLYGGLPKSISLDDIMLGISVPRNENLANVFYRLSLIEAYGTGIPRILRSYGGGFRKPVLQTTNNVFKITLPNRNASGLMAAERPPYPYESFDTKTAPAPPNENEAKTIALFKNQGEKRPGMSGAKKSNIQGLDFLSK